MLYAMAELIGFHHVGVTVTDLDASATWYATVLGFEELFREENDRSARLRDEISRRRHRRRPRRAPRQ